MAMVWTLGSSGGKEHNDIVYMVYMAGNWAPSEGEQATFARSRGELGSDRYCRRQIQNGIPNQT